MLESVTQLVGRLWELDQAAAGRPGCPNRINAASSVKEKHIFRGWWLGREEEKTSGAFWGFYSLNPVFSSVWSNGGQITHFHKLFNLDLNDTDGFTVEELPLCTQKIERGGLWEQLSIKWGKSECRKWKKTVLSSRLSCLSYMVYLNCPTGPSYIFSLTAVGIETRTPPKIYCGNSGIETDKQIVCLLKYVSICSL